MTHNERAKLRALLEQATPGSWELTPHWGFDDCCGIADGQGACAADTVLHVDAQLIVAVHNALPALLDELDSKDREIARLEEFRSYWDDMYGQGYAVANWHQNGELEPLDSFLDSANDAMEGGANE